MRRCPASYCPTLIPDGERYCAKHQAEYEAKRGNARARGYGSSHERLRARVARAIAEGRLVACARCGYAIRQGDAWHLDHDDNDRSRYVGASHASCNTAAGGRKGAAVRNARSD